MKQIQYLKGDATNPMTLGNKIIAHVCNDVGGWGKGFVLAISSKWTQPEMDYREWYKSGQGFFLGKMKLIQVEEDIFVANMIAQHHLGKDSKGNPPIRYDALEQTLEQLALEANWKNASVHMPRIGCGLAGGKWEVVEKIINKALTKNGVDVYVYDFEYSKSHEK